MSLRIFDDAVTGQTSAGNLVKPSQRALFKGVCVLSDA